MISELWMDYTEISETADYIVTGIWIMSEYRKKQEKKISLNDSWMNVGNIISMNMEFLLN